MAAITSYLVLFRAMSVAPALLDKLAQARGRPVAADRRKLVVYCRWLNERRVFSVPYSGEVVECCTASLSETLRVTSATMAELDHPAAQAALGAIQDAIRGFLDVWGGFRTRWDGHPIRRMTYAEGDAEIADFFKDLGDLRGSVRVFLNMIKEIEPKAEAPSIAHTARIPQESE